MARRFLALWGPVVLYMALIFVLSSQPRIPGVDRVSDKVLHALAYAGLGILAIRATHGGPVPARPEPSALAAVFTILYGVLDEIHQAFVPGRSPDVRDAAADAVGFAAALVAWTLALGAGPIPGVLRRRR